MAKSRMRRTGSDDIGHRGGYQASVVWVTRPGTGMPQSHGQQQTLTVFDQQRALTSHLMEQVCDPQNLVRAYRRVRSNKGKPGVDGMTVEELADWLRNHQEKLRTSLREGT